jgi:hypothetical protein
MAQVVLEALSSKPSPPHTYRKGKGHWECSSLVECLLSLFEAPGSIPSSEKKNEYRKEKATLRHTCFEVFNFQ